MDIVQGKIEKNQEGCNHLNIVIDLLNSKGDYDYTCECLFCGKNNIDDKDSPKIHTGSYLQIDERVPFSFQIRRSVILSSSRQIALEYVIKNPLCTIEELVIILNKEIDRYYEESIDRKSKKKKVII